VTEVDEATRKLIRKIALENALKYKGHANTKSVTGILMAENPDLRSKVQLLIPLINAIVDQVNSLTEKQIEKELSIYADDSKEQKKRTKQKIQNKIPPLPNVEQYKQIVMRLAPYPSGPLHIGNARMVILNDEYVKRYHGKLILAYDDTIGGGGKQILPEAYDLIE